MNRILFSIFFILGLQLLIEASEPPRKVASVEGITEYQFSNGLRLLLFPDNSQSKVTVNMTVLVGSRQEGYGETGMAHLLEHMVFKGTPRHAHIPRELQEHGAQFNGSTSDDRVNYFETLSATDENLEFAVELEADRLMNSYIKKEDLESEMTVVRNEFERSENSPMSVLGKRISAVAYDWHNYGKPTIGNRSDIERVPVENLRAFYKKFYQPDNIILVLAGRFEEKRGLELVGKYFGTLPRPDRKLENTYTEEPGQDGERLVTLRRVGDVGAVGLAYHIPSGPHEDSAPLQVLASIFRTRPSGRLYKAVVATRKAASVSAYAGAEHDPGLMSIDAEAAHDSSLEELRNLLVSTVESVGDEGVTDEEVNRARQEILKAREQAATDTSRIAVSLSEWAAQGDWRLYFLHRDRIEKVKTDDIKRVAARYLQRNNRTVGLFIPSENVQRLDIPATPDVQAMVANYKGRAAIAEGEIFDAAPANVESRAQRIELPERIKTTFMPKKTRGEEVYALLTLRYGNQENLRGFESAGALLPDLMLRGTRKLDYQQLRDELDGLKATISTGGGGGRGRRGGGGGGGGTSIGVASFSIQAKRETFPAVLELLHQILREPTLPVEEFELMKRERLASLEQMKTEPAMLAPRLLQRELNPYSKEDVRYVPTIDESIARLKGATHAQLEQLYRDYLGAQAGELTIVGDFEPEKCVPILKQILSGWKGIKPYARIANPLLNSSKGAEHTINTPDKANATYSAGLNFAMKDDEPDYPALVIGNFILGGSTLSSRLGDRIRQKDGLSYGVSSGLNASAFDPRAGLTITAICNPKNINRVQADVVEEIARLLQDGVTREEVEKAKQGYLQAQKVARASDAALANVLSSLSYAGRTMAYQTTLEQRIEKLTPEAVTEALRKRIDPKHLVVVTAGDFGEKVSNPVQ